MTSIHGLPGAIARMESNQVPQLKGRHKFITLLKFLARGQLPSFTPPRDRGGWGKKGGVD